MTRFVRQLLLPLLLLAAAAPAAAQQPDSRGYRGNDGKTYGERDMECTADKTAAGNTQLTQWSFDQKAIEELVEQWKRNSPNYRSPEQIAAGEAGRRQLIAADARRAAILGEIQAELAINNSPFYAYDGQGWLQDRLAGAHIGYTAGSLHKLRTSALFL